VEPGPLPPHERTWRHPSELGPTASDVDAASSIGPHTKMLAAASGVLAMMLIVAIVVTATPNQSDAPIALSATTTPRVAFTSASASTETVKTPRHTIAPATALLLVSLSATPNQVAAAPQLSAALPAVADELPESSDDVMIQTADMTYHCTWADVKLLEMPDGTMVVDEQGQLVAHVDDGEFIPLVDE
jgi:hypothetical protein